VALPAAAIRFALAHPAVDTLVVGARSRAEVVANADHARAAIPAAFWAELKASGLLPSDAPVPTEEP
jgi:D-threo-aldose 1-dehydrogenase